MGHFAGIRVLVVEDEFLVAMDAEDMLRSFGFEDIRIESRAEPALEAVEREAFGLVLLDMNLNGRRSDALALALAARSIPFVVTTGYQLAEADLEAFGGPAYVRKPYGAAQLRCAVDAALGPACAPRALAAAEPAGHRP
jgi:CheY-like chemotaxis protein